MVILIKIIQRCCLSRRRQEIKLQLTDGLAPPYKEELYGGSEIKGEMIDKDHLEEPVEATEAGENMFTTIREINGLPKKK